MEVVIDVVVTRHEGALRWLREESASRGFNLRDARLINGNATEEDVKGKNVIGNLPMSLASLCNRFFAIEFAGSPPRRAEYGPEEMRACGASIVEYKVQRV